MDETTAATATDLLRTSKDPLFRRLRDLLAERGVNPQSDALAELFPLDASSEFGIAVTAEQAVFTFVLRYGPGDFAGQAVGALLEDWTELPQWSSSRYAANVREALEVLDS